MKTRKKVIWTIFILSLIIIVIIVLITSDLTKYFAGAGYLITWSAGYLTTLPSQHGAIVYFTVIIILLFLLFLVGVWLGRGKLKMTFKEREAYYEEGVGLKARENVRRKARVGFRRKERQDSRGRNKWKPNQS